MNMVKGICRYDPMYGEWRTGNNDPEICNGLGPYEISKGQTSEPKGRRRVALSR